MKKYLIVYQSINKAQNSLEIKIKSYIDDFLKLTDRKLLNSKAPENLEELIKGYVEEQNQKHTRSKPMRLEVTHDKGDYVFIIYDGQKNLWISFILYHFNTSTT